MERGGTGTFETIMDPLRRDLVDVDPVVEGGQERPPRFLAQTSSPQDQSQSVKALTVPEGDAGVENRRRVRHPQARAHQDQEPTSHKECLLHLACCTTSPAVHQGEQDIRIASGLEGDGMKDAVGAMTAQGVPDEGYGLLPSHGSIVQAKGGGGKSEKERPAIKNGDVKG